MNKKQSVNLGDCIEKLKSVSDNYFDLVVADPPYWKVVGKNGITNGEQRKIILTGVKYG